MTVRYICDGCGKIRDYLSDSWSEIEIASFEQERPTLLHHCLECRSDKTEWQGSLS